MRALHRTLPSCLTRMVACWHPRSASIVISVGIKFVSYAGWPLVQERLNKVGVALLELYQAESSSWLQNTSEDQRRRDAIEAYAPLSDQAAFVRGGAAARPTPPFALDAAEQQYVAALKARLKVRGVWSVAADTK
jgi:hypothetical protein